MRFPSDEILVQQAIQSRSFHPSGEWTEFPRSVLDGSIAARFEEMAARYPDRIAVEMAQQQLTYALLNEQANQVAHCLLAQPVDREKPVILLLAHSPVAVVAMLGVLKSGNFYTPFDPTQPLPHLRQKAEDSQAHLILTDHQHCALATQMNGSGAEILCLDELNLQQSHRHYACQNPQLPIAANDDAVLLYTSGSTGTPKGIRLSQRALLHRVTRQSEIIHLSCEDRCACVHSYDAIAGIRDLFCPLLSGAATCLFNLKVRSISELPTWVQQTNITILGFVTPTFRHLLNQVTPGSAFAQVRMICIGGDTLYRQDIEQYRQHFPPTCVLYNSLGATETAGGFCYYLFDHHILLPHDPLPVGYPMADMAITILDEHGELVTSGTIGEIALTTPYLSTGYWQSAAQTASRFCFASTGSTYLTGDSGWLQADGCLRHLGRKDSQVKIRGYRVEVSEIEIMLLSHPAIQEVAVVAHKSKAGESFLAAYWVAKPGMTATAQMLKRWLLAIAPPYKVPTLFLLLDALPLTANGKIDRRALPTPTDNLTWEKQTQPDTAYRPPLTPLETQLTLIWEEVLGVQPIGVDDRFLELGGDSLRSMQVHARIVSQLQTDLPARLLFECATIAELAVAITAHQVSQIGEEELEGLLATLEL